MRQASSEVVHVAAARRARARARRPARGGADALVLSDEGAGGCGAMEVCDVCVVVCVLVVISTADTIPLIP